MWINDDSPKDIKDEPSPSKKGSRKGGRTPVKISIQNKKTESEVEPTEETEEVKPDTKEDKKSSPFKLLFSTVGDYNNDTDEPEIKVSKVEEEDESTPDKELSEVNETPVSSPREETVIVMVDSEPEKVEPDSTTNMEDVFDSLLSKEEGSSRSGKKMPGTLSF